MKLNGKHTGLQAGDILEVWTSSRPENDLIFEIKRDGEKLEFDGKGSFDTTLRPVELHLISLLQDFTGLEFKRLGESRYKGSFYLLK